MARVTVDVFELKEIIWSGADSVRTAQYLALFGPPDPAPGLCRAMSAQCFGGLRSPGVILSCDHCLSPGLRPLRAAMTIADKFDIEKQVG